MCCIWSDTQYSVIGNDRLFFFVVVVIFSNLIKLTRFLKRFYTHDKIIVKVSQGTWYDRFFLFILCFVILVFFFECETKYAHRMSSNNAECRMQSRNDCFCFIGTHVLCVWKREKNLCFWTTSYWTKTCETRWVGEHLEKKK